MLTVLLEGDHRLADADREVSLSAASPHPEDLGLILIEDEAVVVHVGRDRRGDGLQVRLDSASVSRRRQDHTVVGVPRAADACAADAAPADCKGSVYLNSNIQMMLLFVCLVLGKYSLPCILNMAQPAYTNLCNKK